ncbi:MAG: carboxy terminal-processing peptidase [Akkermansiaceae bacterium]|nr:carboxy terminal-processing peptidase [Akkermansiaceae bacterium]MCP5544907.1 carboxy terminal-processing peptidase [Akkermansiaceae bacterium]MCP5549012.1 carboxy terminal-processing peptidase [Akkermansiaceae bacterium]
MTFSRIRNAACAAIAATLSFSACAQQADFNEVGRQMAIMLQNSHFARLDFDEKLSQRFLDDYLRDLDFQRLYFTQKDIDRFNAEYGDRLHNLLLQGNSIAAAKDIYGTFQARVEERVAQADELLKGEFDFTEKETVLMSRKDAPWPRDEKDAADIWRRQIKEAVLAEVLRREMIAKLAKEQGKDDPGADDRSPNEKVALRYKRFLASVQDVDEEDVANYFLSSVSRAYDPHTEYMSYREMSRFKDGMRNELVGIGALLQGEEDGATKIKGIVVGGPADREGSLRLNDRIVGVDTVNTGRTEDMVDIMFMKIDKVVDLIRGKEGTTVALKVEPAGGTPGETKIIRIERDRVEMKDEQASGELIVVKRDEGSEKRVGVITLPSFYADFDEGKVRSSVDVERILKRLIEEKIDGLILDLRNNGGGSLEEVRRMTGFFLERGPVVQVKNTLGQIQVKNSENGKPIYNGPMVVMTDKSSASASEILAGALQDFNRAVIVGESSTYGKGTVQQPMDIGRMLPLFAVRNRAGYLKVTIQKFYRPSGSSTQLDGVASDVQLPSMLDALEVGERYMDHALPHDMIRRAPDFKPLDPQNLFVERLKELSQKRVNLSKDFRYIIEDVMKTKERIKKNIVSLNKQERDEELASNDAEQKERNVERRKRFAEMTKADKDRFTFYKVTLDDLEKGADLKSYDPSDDSGDYMRRAKEETEELDETPEWPTGLDPEKRETIAIVGDLIELTDNARMLGTLK